MVQSRVRLLNGHPLLLETDLHTLTVLDSSAEISLYLLESFLQLPVCGIPSATVFSGGVILLAKVEVLLAQFLVLLIQLVQGLVRRITLRSGLSELLLDSLSLCMAECTGGDKDS